MTSAGAAKPGEADLEEDGARKFSGLDARETQEALAEEMGQEEVTDSVTEEQEEQEAAEEVEAPDAQAAEEEGAAPADLWSEEDILAHKRMAEALLFAAAEPLDEKTLADRLPAEADVAGIIERLVADYEERGVHLRQIDGKWRFVTAPDMAPVLEKERVVPRRLSRAAMETLAIIAYHQPCTRADIEDVRGVQVAKGSLDQLLEIGWVRIAGKRRDVPGRPILYRTTQDFLEQFGLESVQDLPGLSDLKAAGLLDARLPPGFSVPNPSEAGEDEDVGDDEDETEFAQDFLSEEESENADI